MSDDWKYVGRIFQVWVKWIALVGGLCSSTEVTGVSKNGHCLKHHQRNDVNIQPVSSLENKLSFKVGL